MARTVLLASGTTAATSTAVTVAGATPQSVAAFVPSGALPVDLNLEVRMQTGGTDNRVGFLTKDCPLMKLDKPGTYTVSRPVMTTAVGVNGET